MAARTNTEIVEGIIAAFNAHDPDGLAEPLVDDAQFINVNGAWTIWALADRRDAEHRRPPRPAALEHDPEKWEPVFGKDHAQTRN